MAITVDVIWDVEVAQRHAMLCRPFENELTEEARLDSELTRDALGIAWLFQNRKPVGADDRIIAEVVAMSSVEHLGTWQAGTAEPMVTGHRIEVTMTDGSVARLLYSTSTGQRLAWDLPGVESSPEWAWGGIESALAAIPVNETIPP